MHRILRPSSKNGRRIEKRLGDEYQNFLILVAQDSSLKAMRLIAAVGTKLKGIKKCENKIVRNKLVRIVSQNFYMKAAELISANRGVWLGSAEFISAISEFLRKFADFICVSWCFYFLLFYTTVNVLFSVFGMLGKPVYIESIVRAGSFNLSVTH